MTLPEDLDDAVPWPGNLTRAQNSYQVNLIYVIHDADNDDDDDDDERICFNVAWVRGLQGHVTVTVGHVIVSAVRRSLVRAAV